MKEGSRVSSIKIKGADGSVVYIWHDGNLDLWKIRKAESQGDLDLNKVEIDSWDSLRDAVDDAMEYIEDGS